MATWIESHSNLRANKKLKPLCDKLNISRAQAIGHLHMLWWWAIDNREDGDLSGLFDRDLATACDWTGDASKLRKALQSTGWLTQDMKIKDWFQYAGRLIQDRIRKRKERTIPRTVHGQSTDASDPTVPNRTEPYRKLGLLFQRPQEIVIKRLFAERLKHDIDSEVNQMEYDRLVKMIQADSKIKDPMAVAIYRASHG